MAKAAASKAGPKLADVAGRARRRAAGCGLFLLGFLGIGVRGIGLLRLLQGLDYRVEGSIEDHRRMLQSFERSAIAFAIGTAKEIAAMEFHGEVSVLEQVSSEHQNH